LTFLRRRAVSVDCVFEQQSTLQPCPQAHTRTSFRKHFLDSSFHRNVPFSVETSLVFILNIIKPKITSRTNAPPYSFFSRFNQDQICSNTFACLAAIQITISWGLLYPEWFVNPEFDDLFSEWNVLCLFSINSENNFYVLAWYGANRQLEKILTWRDSKNFSGWRFYQRYSTRKLTAL
jgi:hypothetical protein